MSENVKSSDVWESNSTVIFQIPEYIAWEIHNKYDFDGRVIPNFDRNLRDKILQFLQSIV